MVCRRLQGGGQRVEALDVALGASLPCQEREYRLAVLLQRSGESHPGEEPSWVVELQPLNVVVPAAALLQDGDKSAVEVERGHFELFYGSLLSGQYRLLMGQNRHSLTLGALLGGVFDVTLLISPSVISLNRSLTEAAGMSMTVSSP